MTKLEEVARAMRGCHKKLEETYPTWDGNLRRDDFSEEIAKAAIAALRVPDAAMMEVMAVRVYEGRGRTFRWEGASEPARSAAREEALTIWQAAIDAIGREDK